MAAQEYRNVIERRELAGVVVFAIVIRPLSFS
jgi:hypothetical protein